MTNLECQAFHIADAIRKAIKYNSGEPLTWYEWLDKYIQPLNTKNVPE